MMSPAKFRVASIQMVSGFDLKENLLEAQRLITVAKSQEAKLVVLPEYFCLMGQTDSQKIGIREEFENGPIQDALRHWAQINQMYIVAGTIPLVASSIDKVKNTSLVFSPQGEIICRYDKIHLFSFQQNEESYAEANTIEAGNEPQTFTVKDGDSAWVFGLSICYDLRFPELYRLMKTVDCHILPAAFTYTTGKAHWETLLKARAIENQAYVLASAQGGKHANGRMTWGHSMLIDPWGEIISDLESGPGVVVGDLEKSTIMEIRAKLPSLIHRKL